MEFVEANPHVATQNHEQPQQHEDGQDDDRVDPAEPPAALDLLPGCLGVRSRGHARLSKRTVFLSAPALHAPPTDERQARGPRFVRRPRLGAPILLPPDAADGGSNPRRSTSRTIVDLSAIGAIHARHDDAE